jgi:asparagine synthase (glutamine-hydrolysing)
VIRKTNAASHYVFPSGDRLWEEMDDLIWHQEEPFGSTSIYTQWNVMRLAKQNNVKVLLDGQGADELLGGYNHYYVNFFNHLLYSGLFASLIY